MSMAACSRKCPAIWTSMRFIPASCAGRGRARPASSRTRMSSGWQGTAAGAGRSIRPPARLVPASSSTPPAHGPTRWQGSRARARSGCHQSAGAHSSSPSTRHSRSRHGRQSSTFPRNSTSSPMPGGCWDRPPTRPRPHPAMRSPRRSTSRSPSTGSARPPTSTCAPSSANGPGCAASCPTRRRWSGTTTRWRVSSGLRPRVATGSRPRRRLARAAAALVTGASMPDDIAALGVTAATLSPVRLRNGRACKTTGQQTGAG